MMFIPLQQTSALKNGILAALLFLGVYTLSFTSFLQQAQAHDDEVVNIYSYRQAFLLGPLLEAFSQETGIKTNVIYAKNGLVSRIKTEGELSPADVLIVPSYSILDEAIRADIVRPLPKDWIPSDIPSWLSDRENRKWLALSVRSRIIFASKDRLASASITSYLELADAQYKGRICTRSGLHPYNVTLFAEIYTQHGYDKTLTFLKGLKNNLARKPQGNDRAQLRGISSGVCDLALSNSYYYFIMQNGDADQKAVAKAVYPISPTAKPVETHMNISGIVLTRHAKHEHAAGELIRFMLGHTAQQLYTEQNREWPVRALNNANLANNEGNYTKSSAPDFVSILKAKNEVIKMVKDIGYDD